ncbi:MAG: hypothetical protein ACREEI_02855 [Stellaceae bacterium]
MTVLDKIRTTSSPQDRLASVTAELETERRKLADAQANVETLSAADDATDAKLAAALADVDAIGVSIRLIETRLAGVQRKVAEAERVEAVKRNALRIKNVEKMLSVRFDHARAFSEHMAKAVAEYKALIRESQRAFIAFPGGVNAEALVASFALRQAVANELYRLDGIAPNDPRTGKDGVLPLPGPASPGMDYLDQPTDITPLADIIEAANKFASDVMHGRTVTR